MPHLKPIYVSSESFVSPKPFEVIARCTLFWKLASLACASISALSAMMSHSASTHGRSALGKTPSTQRSTDALTPRSLLGVVRDDAPQPLDPRPLRFGEIAEHIRMHEFLHAWMADAETHALVVVADMRADRAQAIMPRSRPAAP